MPLSLADILGGLILPALAAALLLTVVRYWVPGAAVGRWVPTVGLVLGFLAGYWTRSLGPLFPESHWHWLPYAALMTVAAGPVSRADGVRWWERLPLLALIALVAAWLLVPDWPDLKPSRGVMIGTWTAAVVVLSTILDWLQERWTRQERARTTLPLALTAALGTAAVILALAGSLRFAQMAGAGFAAMTGITMVVWWLGDDRILLRAVGLPVMVLLCGLLLIGQLNSFSDVPSVSYWLVPLSPLMLVATSIGPLAIWQGAKRAILEVTLVGLPLCLAAGLAVASEWGGMMES